MTAITVGTLNLHLRHDRWLDRRDLIVHELVDLQPHLVALQEIDLKFGQGRWLASQVNARLTGSSRTPYRLFQKRHSTLIGGYFEAIGLLTSLPVLASDGISLGYDGRVALRVHVEVTPRISLDFVTTHLHREADEADIREEQAIRLTSWLRQGNPALMQIIAGDFNEIPGGAAIRYIKQSYRSAFEEFRGSEPVATYPTALVPGIDWSGCLDYVFLSQAAGRVADARFFCNRASPADPTLYPSDHVGLLVTISVDGEQKL